jgi:hypothetical protein
MSTRPSLTKLAIATASIDKLSCRKVWEAAEQNGQLNSPLRFPGRATKPKIMTKTRARFGIMEVNFGGIIGSDPCRSRGLRNFLPIM